MTESLRNWALMLLFVSAGCFVYYHLLPSGSVSETAKRILSVVVIFTVSLPVYGMFADLGETELFSFAEEDVSLPQSSGVYLSGTRTVTETEIAAIIKKYTDIPFSVTAEVNIGEENSIVIERVEIVFEKRPPDKEKILAEITSELGMPPEIKVAETDGEKSLFPAE